MSDRAPTTAGDGPTRFARFAYPPNRLGYCGPDDHGALLEYAATGVVDPGLRALAHGFAGAWPYLELIAGANGITDPLDARVVEAYWTGNRLLGRVSRDELGRAVEDRFRRQAGPRWSGLASALPHGPVPHHGFHVFVVYPWVGLLRGADGGEPLRVLDRCRIRWGRVLSAGAGSAVVRSRALEWDGTRLRLGAPRAEVAATAAGGLELAGTEVAVGDVVALHWDWVCERLEPHRLRWLRHLTAVQLDLVNRRLAEPAASPVVAALS